jgi:phage virion morphogenesis protein
MVGVRIELSGHEAALSALSEATRRLGDPTELYNDIGAHLVATTQRRFDTGTAPDGNPWPPSLRARLGLGRTLVDKGMQGGLMGSVGYEADATGLRVGTNLVYGAIHQLGGTIRAKTAKGLRFRIGDRWATKQSVTIPARPFLGLSDEDETEIETLAGEYLEGVFEGSGDAGR